MLTFKKFLDWELRDIGNLYMIGVKNIPSNHIINGIFPGAEFKKFKVRLRNQKYSWKPEFLKMHDKDLERIEYLGKQEWKKRKYYGEFFICDLTFFVTMFIDFQKEYAYQDIFVQYNSDIIIVLSHHGSVWIISDDKNYLKSIAELFKEKGVDITFSDSFNNA